MNEKKKFYEISIEERLNELSRATNLSAQELEALNGSQGLKPEQANFMIENVVGTFALPLGIARNFIVNGREVLVPMAVEEPSVVAAASYMAKLARSEGGFFAESAPSEMIGQLQILDVADLLKAQEAIFKNKEMLLEKATSVDPVLKNLGGGARDIEVRHINESAIGEFLVLHLIFDVRDAMGANAVNTALEAISGDVEAITGGRVLLCILSNLADRRVVKARCTIGLEELAFDDFGAEQVRDNILAA